MAHPIKLRRSPQSRPHQLCLIHHPQTVIIKQTEVHRPAVAAHAITSIQCAREEHVLRADENGVALRVESPFARFFTAH